MYLQDNECLVFRVAELSKQKSCRHEMFSLVSNGHLNAVSSSLACGTCETSQLLSQVCRLTRLKMS